MVIGSAVGVASAETTAMMKTAKRHDFRIPRPVARPAKFRSTKTTGITNAIPKISRMRMAKRMYSLALITLELPSGVKPIRTTTNPGSEVQARAVPAKNSGTAATVNPVA